MFRLWGKIWKDNHLLKDTVICDDSEDTRTHKIFRGLESICYEMDLGNPIWLESTVRHFKKHGKARFYQDNFIEQIDFDYLEIQVIEEDDELFCLKMCTGSETLHCHIVSDPVYLICSEFSCLYFINSLMISLIISSSSGVSIPLKWLPAAAVWRILSAICSTISSFTASSAFSGTGTSSTHVRACST